MYAFARSARWIAIHCIVAGAIGLFALAGFWQLGRLGDRRDEIALFQARQRLPVTDIRHALKNPDTSTYRRLHVSGRYDIDHEIVVLGRSNNDVPGNHVLTPLVFFGDHAVLVDRGWVPVEQNSPPVADASPPRGDVAVVGILARSEGRAPLTNGGAEFRKTVARIDVAGIARALPYRTFPHYLVLQEQQPPQSRRLPEPVSIPKLGEGPHFLYALQWFLFIPIALFGYGAILRREARRRTASPGAA